MNEVHEAAIGGPLAIHFEAKRRILATVKQLSERGETLQEATPEEILEAANKAAKTVFKFDFSISAEPAVDASTFKRTRKRSKKKRGKKSHGNDANKNENVKPTTQLASPRDNAKDSNDSVRTQQQIKSIKSKLSGSSSLIKFRKATGAESEMAKMHLRYGHGRRNMVATNQREHRKQTASQKKDEVASSEFKFNFPDT
ncbi:hypothetical protein CCR75_004365 [Bremia lactucae]|uniref:Uncharacterized protein n=1 Tax=Bremia lactucae TaxID=4779 RepID=A0A976FKB3_BRELC|nr:hypothetical protein CCR75_004365 [Bremia lactucae]